MAKLLRLLKMIKMIRLFKLPHLMKNMENYISKTVLHLLCFVLGALLVTHFAACLFYYVAAYDPHNLSPWIEVRQY